MASSYSSLWNIASREAKRTGVFVAKTYCFLHVTTNYIGFASYAYGPSMIPTLHSSGNVVLTERISTRSQRPIHGDIVVFRSPQEPNKTPLKRVIGIEGDCITFVVVDPRTNNHESKTIVVPKGHVWVQGDYNNSKDSRTFGPIPHGLIQGRVLWRVWPFQDFGPLGPNPT